MAYLAEIYRQYEGKISLRGFMRLVEQPFWRLRDYLRSEEDRQARQQKLATMAEKVKVASGYDDSYDTSV